MKKLYLLLGQEHFDKTSFIIHLKSTVLKEIFCKVEKLSAAEQEGENLLTTLQSKTLFGESRLFVVEFAEKINTKLIPSLINAYNSSEDILILDSPENKLPAWENAKDVSIEKKVFYPLSESDKKSYILKLARDFKRKLTPKGAEYFIKMTGTDKSAIDNLSRTIFPKIPQDKLINEVVLANYLTYSRTETAYTLFYSVLDGDLNLALIRLSNLLQSYTEATLLIASFLGQLRKLFSLASTGGSYDSFQRLRIFHNEKPYYNRALRLYSTQQIEAMIDRTIYYDLIFREEKMEQKNHLLQIYLYELIVKKGQALDFIKVDLPLLP